jgi:hypothetical protein
VKGNKNSEGDDLDRRANVQASLDTGIAPKIVSGYFLLCIFQ